MPPEKKYTEPISGAISEVALKEILMIISELDRSRSWAVREAINLFREKYRPMVLQKIKTDMELEEE